MTAIMRYKSMDWKKNYHVFDALVGNGTMSTFMEIRSHWRRSIQKINFYADKFE